MINNDNITELNQKYLKSFLDYNLLTGVFTYLVDRGKKIKLGSIAGGYNSNGYRSIQINGKRYQAHRLAFLWVTGSFPINVVDHINHVKDDNRWDNLRACNQSENRANSKKNHNNTSGYKGVYFHKPANKWIAQIVINDKNKYLGCFACINDAAKAYNASAIKNFGEFASLNTIPSKEDGK